MTNRPRTKAPDERRNDLLDAARSVLIERGIGALTVDEVTVRAGVAKGTFYLYFRSKEDILAALRERFVDELVADQRARLSELPEADWLGRLELWMELSIRSYLAHAGLHDALFAHQAPADLRTAVHQTNQHLIALLELLQQGHAAGAFALQSPRIAAVLLHAAMHGAADYVIDNPESVDVDRLIADARRLCRQFVTPSSR